MDREVYTIEEAGKLLGVSRNHAYACARSGEIPTIKLGARRVVPRAALDRMLGGELAPERPLRRKLAGSRP